MWRAPLDPAWDLDAWRALARHALCARVRPEAIDWSGQAGTLLGAADLHEAPVAREPPSVPGAFLRLARDVLAHRDPDGPALMYALLWRLVDGEPSLLAHHTDPDVRRALKLRKAVQRDALKMEAFVRFREVPGEQDAFIAWYEPDHHVVDLVAPFFMKRFAGMRWAILTPYRRAVWDGATLTMGDGGRASDAPTEDAGEALWRRYYASIFNPARLNPRAMHAEMPQRFWKHLPEARDLPALMREAAPRVAAMVAREPQAPRRRFAAPVLPTVAVGSGLDAVHAGVRGCRACPLWSSATQAVPGEGPRDACSIARSSMRRSIAARSISPMRSSTSSSSCAASAGCTSAPVRRSRPHVRVGSGANCRRSSRSVSSAWVRPRRTRFSGPASR